jgi:heme-degrading monooxygenase HmoA
VYARFSVINLGPGMRPKMEALADRLTPVFRAQPGFRDVTFLMDEAGGDYGSFSLWETKEDAEAASAAISPHVAAIFRGLLTPWILEVYEPEVGAASNESRAGR